MTGPKEDVSAGRQYRSPDALIMVAAMVVLVAVICAAGPEWIALTWIWVVHSAIGAVLSSPVLYLGRRRVHWGLLDLLAFVLPFAVWEALMVISSVGKSLANLIEPLVFSLAIPIAALLRVLVGARDRERAWSIGLVFLLCLVAVSVYWWTPALPE